MLLQHYKLRPFALLFVIFAMMLVYMISRHLPILLFGVLGSFFVVVAGNFLGDVIAKAQFMEIGFQDDFFYMRSAYDIAHQKNLKFYPLSYANVTREGDSIMLNYIDRTVRLRRDEWPDIQGLWEKLNGY
jgi:hypothetical protein